MLRGLSLGFAAGVAVGGAIAWQQAAQSASGGKPVGAPPPPPAQQKDEDEDEDDLLLCSLCDQRLPKSAFSPKQLRKRAGWRKPKCQKCVDAYELDSNRAPGDPDAKPKCGSHRPRSKQANTLPPAAVAAAPEPTKAPPSAAQPPEFDDVTDPLRKARKAEAVLRARTERVLLVLENCSDDLNHVAVLRTCEALGVMRVWLVEANAAVSLPRVWGDDDADSGGAHDGDGGEANQGGKGSKGAKGGTSGKGSEAPRAPGCGVEAAAQDKSTAAQSRARLRLQARAAQRGFDFDPLLGVRRAQHYCTHLDVRRFPSTQACLTALREDGRTVWVTDLAQDAVPLSGGGGELRLQLPERVAVVLGSEGAGVSDAMLAAADTRVYLPMYGFTESFNLSVSAALVLQRLLDACPESRGDLPPAEIARTRWQWYTQLAKTEAQRVEFEALAKSGGAEPLADVRRPPAHRAEQKRYARNADTKRKLMEVGAIPSAAGPKGS